MSVVVPVHDDPDRLAACLGALAAQTLPGAQQEVVVVDDGSARAPSVAAYPGARLLRQANAGSYAARNRGVAAGRAPVVAFTDADCIPAPDWLERALAVLDAVPGVAVVAGRVEVFRTRAGPRGGVELYDALTAFPQRHFVERYGFGATANLVARRAVLDAVGPFDARLRSGGDAEWGERASAAGHRVVYRDDVVVHHPARASAGELVRKALRTSGGVTRLMALRGQPQPLVRTVADQLAAPWRALPGVLRDGRLHGARERSAYVGASLLHAGAVAAGTVAATSQVRADLRATRPGGR